VTFASITILGDLEPLPERQRLVATLIAAGLVVLIFELVRRRKLREEYSWVWVITAIGLAVLAWQQDLLLTLSRWVGSSNAVSTLFFGALLFLLALVLQYSVRLSRLTHRYRTLGQRLALLEEEMLRLRNKQAREEKLPQRLPEDRDEVA
jgi:ABC-type polysaccharide/polyol phosphate export permease